MYHHEFYFSGMVWSCDDTKDGIPHPPHLMGKFCKAWGEGDYYCRGLEGKTEVGVLKIAYRCPSSKSKSNFVKCNGWWEIGID